MGREPPHVARNGFDPEFKRLLDAARARRASVPLDARWYPEDRPGTVYARAGDNAPTTNDKET